MTPEQFSELRTLLTQMLTPGRDLALYQLAQLGQPMPQQPTTRSLMAEQAGRSDAHKMAPVEPGPGNAGPYSATLVPFAGPTSDADAHGWHVVGARNVPVGFNGTRAEAEAEAERLNAETVPQARIDNPGPYTTRRVSDDRWEIIGASGNGAGFIGNEADANAEAERLNETMAPNPEY